MVKRMRLDTHQIAMMVTENEYLYYQETTQKNDVFSAIATVFAGE
jgi:hypothetical protein